MRKWMAAATIATMLTGPCMAWAETGVNSDGNYGTEDEIMLISAPVTEGEMHIYNSNSDRTWNQQMEDYRNRVEIQINGEDMFFAEQLSREEIEAAKEAGTPYLYSDVKPLIRDGRTYIPFRSVFNGLGAEIEYDSATGMVGAKKDGQTVSFVPGETTYRKNGTIQQMDGKAFVENGRTYVPVRFAAKALGASVGWDESARTVVILDKADVLKQYRGKFRILDEYLQHWSLGSNIEQKIALEADVKIWYDLEENADDMIPIHISFQEKELIAEKAINVDSSANLNLDKLIEWAQKQDNMGQSTLDFMKDLKSIRAQVIVNLEYGQLFVKCDLLKYLGGKADTWYYISAADYMDEEEYAEYKEALAEAIEQRESAVGLHIDDLIALALDKVSMEDAYAVSNLLEFLEGAEEYVGDNGFNMCGNEYYRNYAEDDWTLRLGFLKDNGEVCGLNVSYVMDEDTTGYYKESNHVKVTLEERDYVISFEGHSDMQSVGERYVTDVTGKSTVKVSNELAMTRPLTGALAKFEELDY